MIDPSQFKALVIRPTLEHLRLGGAAAENLLLGTALTESGLRYLHQINGPALGVYQCEPATHADIWSSFLAGRQPLEMLVSELARDPENDIELVRNLAYATAICRMHYYRVPEALPAADDARALTAFYKQHYNTPLGAADPERIVGHFVQAIAT